MNNIPYLLALHSVIGLGPIRLRMILDYFKDPKLAWEAPVSKLREIGIPNSVTERLAETRKILNPHKYMEDIKSLGISWMTIFDDHYPKLLTQIYDPPMVLYYQGELEGGNEKAIAIVGSRKMTSYGRVVTEKFTKALVDNLTIVSGLARGVDSEAHRAALAASGRTIAVLGGGLDEVYPPENRELTQAIIKNRGLVMSEFPPHTPSLPGNFPQRNRIIAGLSLGVLVTEAAQDSGSLITARLALEQGREVFAVPGPVTSVLSKGPIDLIKEGARIVFDPDEILEELGLSRVQTVRSAHAEKDFSEDEKKVLKVLENDTRHIDEIGRQLNLPAAKIAALLLKMEISGLVQNIGAGIYCRR